MSCPDHTDDPPPTRLARAARAAEELAGALWEAIHEELRRPGAPGATDAAGLAERLAEVCSALAALASRSAPSVEPVLEPPAPLGRSGSAGLGSPVLPPPPVEPPALPGRSGSAGLGSPVPPPPPVEPPAPPDAPEIEIHDARKEEAREPQARSDGEGSIAWAQTRAPSDGLDSIVWAQAIDESVERYEVDALPFAVLLVELAGLERLAQAEPAGALEELANRVEEALMPELRPSDTIVRETRGRWWVMATRTDARSAHTVAERLARTVRTAASHRGVPLGVAIGVAVCPADGRDSATLAAHADVALYSARATGRPVAPVDDAA